jgi:hypothetical protein
MAYAVHLVKMRVFKRIEICFMLVGHTHENIDQLFSTYSVKLRTVKAFTLKALMQVARDAFLGGNKPEVSHISEVNDWDTFFKKDNHSSFRNFEHTTNQHVFEIKRDDEASNVVLLRGKMYSSKPLFLPEGGLDILPGPLLQGNPTLQPLQALTPVQREEMASCRRNLESLLGEEFNADVALKEFWDALEVYQDGIPAEAVVPSYRQHAFEWPPSLVNLPQAEPITAQDIEAALPEGLFNDVFPLEVPLCLANAADRQANRVEAVLNNYQEGLTFGQIKVGNVAICLAGDELIGDTRAFRLKMKETSQARQPDAEAVEEIPCPLLTLNQVIRVDQDTQMITWSYLSPSRYVKAKEQLVGKMLAKEPGFFHSRNPTRIEFPFTPEEILIAWDLGEGDDPGCIPFAQQRDALVMIEAMHWAREDV